MKHKDFCRDCECLIDKPEFICYICDDYYCKSCSKYKRVYGFKICDMCISILNDSDFEIPSLN